MHKLPRYGPAARKLFDRRKFLDGTYKTYFAPGQTLFCTDPASPDSETTVTDWNKVKTVLRMPQVVWFTLVMDGPDDSHVYSTNSGSAGTAVTFAYCTTAINKTGSGPGATYSPSHIYDFYWTDGHHERLDNTGATETLGVPSYPTNTMTPGNNKYVQLQTVPDASGNFLWAISGLTVSLASDGHGGLVAIGPVDYFTPDSTLTTTNHTWDYSDIRSYAEDVFSAAVDKLNGLRPGKLWARFNKTNLDGSLLTDESGNPTGSVYKLLAPDPGVDFAGTDFLHVYGTCKGLQDELADPAILEQSISNLKTTYKKFAGYDVWLLSQEDRTNLGDPPSFPADANAPSIPSTISDENDVAIFIVGTSPTVFADRPFPATCDPEVGYPKSVASINATIDAARTAAEDAYDAQPTPDPDSFVEAAKQLADNLSKYGVEYHGDVMAADVDSIVQAIAKHYGFDPDNGNDLPIVG